MKKGKVRQLLKAVNNYVVFFLMVGFAVTCCMLLFVNTLAKTMGLVFTQENVTDAAKITFGNVMLITFLFSVSDYIRRRITVDRPVKIITEATEKIMKGDFSVRIAPLRGAATEEFNRIIEAINKMAQELAGTETLRTDFIANVSHELKTPLAVMDNYATMLRKSGLTEQERSAYAKAISDAARRLAQLITNILKLNKLENQQIFPQKEKFDLTEQLCRCVLHFEDEWEKKNLHLEVDLQEQLQIQSDPQLLELVWNNLLSNAVKFTPEGGTVAVSLKAEGEQVVVAVRDTGCGMKPETGVHIFEKFYQGDTSHAAQGNGLGLALVKRVVDILGGEIAVQSVYGEGSTFTVRIGRNGYGLG